MAVEFNRFYNASMADFVGELARTCRAATKGRKLVLTFYGYSYELANIAKGMAASGHLAAQRLIDRYGDSIDMVCAPFGYGSEREWLGSEPVMSAAETFARNGIMWVNEDDTRTHLDSRPAEKRLQEGASKDLSQSCDVMMRNTAQCAVRGMGCWWMDLKGTGWFADPAIWNVMTQLAPIDRKMAARGTPFAPDVASIIDEESCLHLGWVCGRVSAWTFRQMRGVLARCGAPYGQYLLSDVVRNPIGAKLQLFHAAWALSDTQIAALEKEEQRLLEMMDKAETVEEMIAVESRLTEVETQLNQYKTQKSYYDNEVRHATVYIDLEEVQSYQDVGNSSGFWGMVRKTFRNSIHALGTFFVWLFTGILWLLPFAALACIVWLIVRAIRKKKKQKNGAAALKEPVPDDEPSEETEAAPEARASGDPDQNSSKK